jgi:hypothetical protein
VREPSAIQRDGMFAEVRVEPFGQLDRLTSVVPVGVPQLQSVHDLGIGHDGRTCFSGPRHRKPALSDPQRLLANGANSPAFPAGDCQSQASHECREGRSQVDGPRPHPFGL